MQEDAAADTRGRQHLCMRGAVMQQGAVLCVSGP